MLAPLLVNKRTFGRSLARVLTVHERFDVDEHWRAVSARGAAGRTHALLHYIAERRRRRERWIAAFTRRDTPLALAWGTRDPVSGAHVLEWAQRERPDADVLALPVGHYPQLEASAEVASLIARLAARVTAKS